MAIPDNAEYIKHLENCIRQYLDYFSRKNYEMQNSNIRPDELILVKYAQKTYEQLTKQLEFQYKKARRARAFGMVGLQTHASETGVALGCLVGDYKQSPCTSNRHPTVTSSEQKCTFIYSDIYLYKLFGPHRCNHGITCPGFLNAKYCAPLSRSFGDVLAGSMINPT